MRGEKEEMRFPSMYTTVQKKRGQVVQDWIKMFIFPRKSVCEGRSMTNGACRERERKKRIDCLPLKMGTPACRLDFQWMDLWVGTRYSIFRVGLLTERSLLCILLEDKVLLYSHHMLGVLRHRIELVDSEFFSKKRKDIIIKKDQSIAPTSVYQ